jgi:hypothetical protein
MGQAFVMPRRSSSEGSTSQSCRLGGGLFSKSLSNAGSPCLTFLMLALSLSRTIHDLRSPENCDLASDSPERILLAVEFRVVIGHNFQRRDAVGVVHQRVNLSGSRSIIETLDWHAEDRRHNRASQSLVVSLPRFGSHAGIP